MGLKIKIVTLPDDPLISKVLSYFLEKCIDFFSITQKWKKYNNL